jgi:hypothetical protein
VVMVRNDAMAVESMAGMFCARDVTDLAGNRNRTKYARECERQQALCHRYAVYRNVTRSLRVSCLGATLAKTTDGLEEHECRAPLSPPKRCRFSDTKIADATDGSFG